MRINTPRDNTPRSNTPRGNMPPERRPFDGRGRKTGMSVRSSQSGKSPSRSSLPEGTIPVLALQPDSEPVREENKVNKYYLSLSTKYKVMKLMTIVTLVAFCVGMVTIYREDITVENFRYMLRDFDINSTKYTGEFDKITYSAGSDSHWALFKGDLAVVSPDSLYIYSMSGQTEMSETFNMTDPQIKASDRYILVYDTSDTNPVFSLFNTFSMLYTERLTRQINAASVANNGYFAIATRTEEYKGAVFVYNSNFQLVNRIYKDKHIMDVKMRPDGGEVLVLSSYDSGGEWCAEIMTVAPGSDSASTTINIVGSMPVKACYSRNGGFAVLLDNCVIFYDAEGFEVNRYLFGSDIPVTYGMTADFTMLAFNKTVLGNEKIVRFWDSSGVAVGTANIDGRILCTASDSTRFYIQTPGQLRIMNPVDETYTSVPTATDPLALLVYSDGILVMCAADGATVFDISGANAESEETTG
jgi:hypothetical protein